MYHDSHCLCQLCLRLILLRFMAWQKCNYKPASKTFKPLKSSLKSRDYFCSSVIKLLFLLDLDLHLNAYWEKSTKVPLQHITGTPQWHWSPSKTVNVSIAQKPPCYSLQKSLKPQTKHKMSQNPNKQHGARLKICNCSSTVPCLRF